MLNVMQTDLDREEDNIAFMGVETAQKEPSFANFCVLYPENGRLIWCYHKRHTDLFEIPEEDDTFAYCITDNLCMSLGSAIVVKLYLCYGGGKNWQRKV